MPCHDDTMYAVLCLGCNELPTGECTFGKHGQMPLAFLVLPRPEPPPCCPRFFCQARRAALQSRRHATLYPVTYGEREDAASTQHGHAIPPHLIDCAPPHCNLYSSPRALRYCSEAANPPQGGPVCKASKGTKCQQDTPWVPPKLRQI